MSDTHDSKRNHFKILERAAKLYKETGEEQDIYDDINSKLDSCWSLDDGNRTVR